MNHYPRLNPMIHSYLHASLCQRGTLFYTNIMYVLNKMLELTLRLIESGKKKYVICSEICPCKPSVCQTQFETWMVYFIYFSLQLLCTVY